MIISFVFATNHLPSKNVTLHYHYGTPKKGFQANIVFKQIAIQSKRYTSTTYNLQVLKLQSARYMYTTHNVQANNNSVNMLHLHNL